MSFSPSMFATEQCFASLSLLVRCKNLPFSLSVLSLDFFGAEAL